MITILLIPALLLGSGAEAAAEPSPSLTAFAVADGYSALVAEYDAALATWQASLDATEDRGERTELRRNHPAKTFKDRFDALATSGEGQANLWLVGNLRHMGLKASERGAAAAGYFDTIFTKHVGAEWLGDAVAALMQEAKIEDADKIGYLRKAVAGAKVAKAKAPAMFGLGQMLFASEETKAEGEGLLKTVAADYAKTPWGTMARAAFITEADLEVGKPAPDFYGESIDGFGFSLSDYRGKVVLLDFYGFW